MTAGEAKVSPTGGDLEGAKSLGFLNLMVSNMDRFSLAK